MIEKPRIYTYPVRRWSILIVFIAAMLTLSARVIELQIMNKDFLQDHGNARSIRTVDISAHRGDIYDRNGEPLAISTPVNSIWATPKKVIYSDSDLSELSRLLEIDKNELIETLKLRLGREFVYIKRHIDPVLTEKIMLLDIPGIYAKREFKRYYPTGEVTSHIIGFTNVDDIGQEGLELAYNDWLVGKPGSKRVLKDRLGRIVEDIESVSVPDPGKPLYLSIDKRIQYLAYRELKSAVSKYRAKSGSLIMIDARSGEILALVGQPSFNPNNRSNLNGEYYRCRALTDVFEPGSTFKPFTIAAALQSGEYTPTTSIDTNPGYFKLGGHKIQDAKNYGLIDVATVIKKSSNVGASKIALSLEPETVWETLSDFGFGKSTGSGFPGESAGFLPPYNNWSELELATISFGYGISVNALQLSQAYLILANNGKYLPVSFHKISKPYFETEIIMLESVVKEGGTGQRAAVAGYRVAGKTGTVHKSRAGGYSEDKYQSLFAGFAPVSDPRLVSVVVIDQPVGEQYYGGLVAAPVFSRVMTGALRLLNVPPDALSETNGTIIAKRDNIRMVQQ